MHFNKSLKGLLCLVPLMLVLSACSDLFQSPSVSYVKPNTPATMRPYTVAGKRYYPSKVDIGDVQVGIASWYGPGFHGKLTSNGERFNTNGFTAAHKTLPMNTIVRVDNLENQKSVIVRINDRGPFVSGRIIDLSNAAAKAIAMTGKGTAKVRLSVIGFAQANKPTEAAFNQIAKASVNQSFNQTAKAIANTGVESALKEVVGGNFMLQLGAFKNQQNALAFARKLSYGIYQSKVLNSNDGLFRVFLTGFKSEAEAHDFANLKHFVGSFIFRE